MKYLHYKLCPKHQQYPNAGTCSPPGSPTRETAQHLHAPGFKVWFRGGKGITFALACTSQLGSRTNATPGLGMASCPPDNVRRSECNSAVGPGSKDWKTRLGRLLHTVLRSGALGIRSCIRPCKLTCAHPPGAHTPSLFKKKKSVSFFSTRRHASHLLQWLNRFP